MQKAHPSLPIFHIQSSGRQGFYVPGSLAPATDGQARRIMAGWARGKKSGDPLAARLEEMALSVERSWREMESREFEPRCLTLHPVNQCQMSCTYCFVPQEIKQSPNAALDEVTALAAAKLVAESCAEAESDFHLVMHGGGEPSLAWPLLQSLVRETRRIASEHGIAWQGYIASNGALPPEQAAWLANNFDLIGISCDGPPHIHDSQRAGFKKIGSVDHIRRTVEAINRECGNFKVRATITRASLTRQAEVVEFLAGELGVGEISLEPVYKPYWAGRPVFQPEDAPIFVEQYLAAQETASRLGAELDYSGVRLDQLHGPYCQILRDTVQVGPEGVSYPCFLASAAGGRARQPVGRLNEPAGRFELNSASITEGRRRSLAVPTRCRECPAMYSCVRECPEICLLQTSASQMPREPGFRCLVNQGLTKAWLEQALNELEPQPEHEPPARLGRLSSSRISAFLQPVRHLIDVTAIAGQAAALQPSWTIGERELPPPLYTEKGFEQTGDKCWQSLKHQAEASRTERAISIYLHVPFCASRCGFCDCYSLPIGNNKQDRQVRLVEALLSEIKQFSGLSNLARRKVTTVHFGGGTPDILAPDLLGDVVGALRDGFNVSDSTELAWETTASSLTKLRLAHMASLGFSRLHVGVQTLRDSLRRKIGRQLTANQVIERLGLALDLGFITSIDLLYGLPGQEPGDLLSDLKDLLAAGVEGCSLYELQLSRRNQAFMSKMGMQARNAFSNYLLFQAAEQYLRKAGLTKNHFSHFARGRDLNLYYTHAARGEDLVSLGPSADGVLGGYHYLHHDWKGYSKPGNSAPPLAGGIMEHRLESLAAPVCKKLMVGQVDLDLMDEMGLAELTDIWKRAAMFDWDHRQKAMLLTANGSWFVNEMINQLRAALE